MDIMRAQHSERRGGHAQTDERKRGSMMMNTRRNGATKGAQRKKRRSLRDSLLWDLIVNNDDICFTHVLPRLNPTDVKFLHEVNNETRDLIKRSSRAVDLHKTFKVRESSSISTL